MQAAAGAGQHNSEQVLASARQFSFLLCGTPPEADCAPLVQYVKQDPVTGVQVLPATQRAAEQGLQLIKCARHAGILSKGTILWDAAA